MDDGAEQSAKRSSARGPLYGVLALIGIVSIVPPIRLARLIDRFGVDVPYYDEWPVAGLIRRLREGELLFEHLFAQHSVHRVFFPRIILVSLGQYTNWNVRAELVVNFALAVVLMLLLALQIGLTSRRAKSSAILFLIPIASVAVFSLSQYENWLWGWQNQIFLSIICAIGALFVLSAGTMNEGRAIAATILGVVASFSFANGLLVWPLGLIPILLRNRPFTVRTARVTAIWVVLAAIVIFFYLRGLKFPPRVASAEQDWSTPLNIMKGYLAYVGAAFASMHLVRALAAGAAGLVGAALALIWIAMRERQRVDVWLPGVLLMLFSLGSGVLIVAGRADYGPQQALASRYITISNLFWIGLLLTIATFALEPSLRRPLMRGSTAGLMAIVAALTLHANVTGFDSMRQFSHMQRVLRYQLLQEDRSPQMQLLYPDVAWLHWYKEVARRKGIWAWRPGAPSEIFAPPPASYEDL